ncbi:MAG: amidohydrolase family protein [Rhizobacter sp.]
MTYATATRVIHDADAHIMETPNWVASYADASIRDRLKPLSLSKAGNSTIDYINKQVERTKDPVKTAEISTNVVAGPKGWSALGAFDRAERSRALDDLGFAKQLVFSTFAAGQYLSHEDVEVRYAGARAHNRGMAEFCQDDKRLIAVGQVSLSEPELALQEIKEGIRLGCGAFWLPTGPAGDRSPGHPDLDPVWRLLSDSGIPFMLHVGPSHPIQPKGYDNTGRPRPPDVHGGGENLRFKDLVALSLAPQLFLTSMVGDGVFDRHPELRGGVIELGAGWVPQFLRQMDIAHGIFAKTDPMLASFKLKPSEFIRRAVKFTPFPSEDVGRMVADAGADLFMFSSDYPHPEGTNDPIGRFERSMGALSDDARTLFYSKNFEQMMQVA